MNLYLRIQIEPIAFQTQSLCISSRSVAYNYNITVCNNRLILPQNASYAPTEARRSQPREHCCHSVNLMISCFFVRFQVCILILPVLIILSCVRNRQPNLWFMLSRLIIVSINSLHLFAPILFFPCLQPMN